MTLHKTPRGSPVKSSESSSGPSNYSTVKSSKSSGASSYETAATSHIDSPIKTQTPYPYQSPTDSTESLSDKPTYAYPNNMIFAYHNDRVHRVIDKFNQGQLREAQTMAEELLFCYPSMVWAYSAPLHAMLGVYPFGLWHAEKACNMYRIIAKTHNFMRETYENARESLDKAQKIEALWEAQEKKIEKLGIYTIDQIRHKRWEAFYYSVYKHTHKEEFKALVDAVSQPSSKSASSSKPTSSSMSASNRRISGSSESKDKSVLTDPVLRTKFEHKRLQQNLAVRTSAQEVHRALEQLNLTTYGAEIKAQRKTSSQKVDAESKGKSVQPGPVRMKAENAPEVPPEERLFKRPMAMKRVQSRNGFYDLLRRQRSIRKVSSVERQNALGTEKITVNGTATATDDDEPSGTDRWTDIPTLANVLYRAQLKVKTSPGTNDAVPKGSGGKAVYTWNPNLHGDPTRGDYF